MRTPVLAWGVAAAGALGLAPAAQASETAPPRAEAQAPGIGVSAGQLLINQRIAQAALRRVNALEDEIRGVPPREYAQGDPADVTLSVRQLRINQRVAQAALRRANALRARLDAEPAPDFARGDPDRLALSAAQLRINQRIAQAAVRRAAQLRERIPRLPVPRPPPADPSTDRLIGTAINPRQIVVTKVERGPGTPGEIVTIIVPDDRPGPFLGETVGGEGVRSADVFFFYIVSFEPVGE